MRIKPIDIHVPIIIDNTTQFKSNIDIKWKFTKNIYGGYIYEVSDGVHCDYIGKIIKIEYIDDTDDYTAYDRVRNELIIAKLMSDEGIGPTIYDMCMNENEGIIIMEKYDGNLRQLMLSYFFDRTIPIENYLNDVAILVDKMHSLNIYHADLHLRNIFYKGSALVIGDFGFSLRTDVQELKDSEQNNLGKFID